MFNCDWCRRPTGPKVSPVFSVVFSYPKEYLNYDMEGEPVASFGQEIGIEHKLCPECSKVPARREATVDYGVQVALGRSMQEHGKKCKANFLECHVCQRNLTTYGLLPLPASNKILSEPRAKRFTQSLAAIAMENTLNSTYHLTSKGSLSKRTARDTHEALALLGAYEKMGGRL